MSLSWKPGEFKIGINMAGAVSAGAYTAGVLDFLMEALEEWQSAKEALRDSIQQPVPGASPTVVPLHDVKIEIFTGASAGGMCAAIASVMVQENFVHIQTAMETSTNNVFYESWVNTIDIRELLKTQDLTTGGPVISLLDSTIIDRIAATALIPGPPLPRPYISSQLTLMLTLSNVRGTPYQLYTDPNPVVEEFIEYYGDRIRFEATVGNAPPSTPQAKPLPSGQPGAGAWLLLQDAAKATGAFPIFLAPRIIVRDTADYSPPLWEPLGTAPGPVPVTPDFPVPPPATLQTLNVDGGITDNDPFELAHDFLATQNPKAQEGHNPSNALDANCAVITVAPFPASEKFDPAFDPKANSNVWTMLGRLFSVLISQSRFLGESLESLTSGVSFSRFAIAPSDPGQSDGHALQCGLLGAFGGFLERGFRAHDFLLGRRNCQMFLKQHFCLPKDNPVIAAGIASAGPFAAQMDGLLVGPPNAQAQPQTNSWMPIIPLVGSAALEVPEPVRAKISPKSLDDIASLAVSRIKALKSPLLSGAPTVLRALAATVLVWPFSLLVKSKIRATLASALCPNVEGQQASDCAKNTTSSA
jgi:hypothetical protein